MERNGGTAKNTRTMTALDIKRIVVLLILGAVTLAAGIIVLARNRSLDTDLLASVAIIGGLAIIIVALPLGRGGNGKPE